MQTTNDSKTTPAIRLRADEHELVRRAARLEGRTLGGLVSLAVRQYMVQNQPKLMKQLLKDVPL